MRSFSIGLYKNGDDQRESVFESSSVGDRKKVSVATRMRSQNTGDWEENEVRIREAYGRSQGGGAMSFT